MDTTNNPTETPRIRATTDVVRDLEILAQEPGFLYSLALILLRDLFVDPAKVQEINRRQQLSFQELSFLLGLMVKHPIDASAPASEEQTHAQITRAYHLLQDLHDAHLAPFVAKLEAEFTTRATGAAGTSFEDFFGSGQLLTELFFYGGSAAYDFQFWDYAPQKYQSDADWLEHHGNIDLPSMVAISQHLKALHEERLRNLPHADTFETFCRGVLSIFCFSRGDLRAFSPKTLDAFLSAFTLSPGHANQSLDCVGSYNEIEAKPVIALEADRYFLPISFNLAQSIYDSPYYWMLSDDAYRDIALKHRGEYAESVAEALLASVFGPTHVFRDVGVYRRRQEMLTDIDVLAIAGNRAVIVQAKAKRLTELARLGDDARLRDDFAAAIQSAYDQGSLARRAILGRGAILRTADGQELDLTECIEDVYIVCLSADHYPAVAHQTAVYLKKDASDPDPLPMSVFDLDVVVSYLRDPYDLLYYFRQRVRWSRHFRAESEIVLLGYHLEHKLYPKPSADMEALDESFAAVIDADLPVRRGQRVPAHGSKELRCAWSSNELSEVIAELKKAGQPGFTDAIFLLHDLSTQSANGLARAIKSTKARTRRDDRIHTAAVEIKDANCGVSYVCLSCSPKDLARSVSGFAAAKKYRTRADTWLGLGALSQSEQLVDAFALIRGPWKKDAHLESFSKIVLKGGTKVVPAWNKVGRNAPCPCGSGAKFKRCCGR